MLPVHRRHQAEKPGADGSQARAKPVHVVHEIERVDDRQNPYNRDGITESQSVDKQGESHVRRDQERGDQQLTAEFCGGPQLVFVVQGAQHGYAQSAEQDGREFNRAAVQPMAQQFVP